MKLTVSYKSIERSPFYYKMPNCEECGKQFELKYYVHLKTPIKQKFCSKQCSKIHWQKKYEQRKLGGQLGIWLNLRFKVFLRDNFTCQYCGRNIKDGIKLVVDHIIAKSKGGTNKFDNLITSCNECNLGKKDILLTEREIRNLKK